MPEITDPTHPIAVGTRDLELVVPAAAAAPVAELTVPAVPVAPVAPNSPAQTLGFVATGLQLPAALVSAIVGAGINSVSDWENLLAQATDGKEARLSMMAELKSQMSRARGPEILNSINVEKMYGAWPLGEIKNMAADFKAQADAKLSHLQQPNGSTPPPGQLTIMPNVAGAITAQINDAGAAMLTEEQVRAMAEEANKARDKATAGRTPKI